jgi:hypothetical protein
LSGGGGRLETFTIEKDMVVDDDYERRRALCLRSMATAKIDTPIRSLIKNLNRVKYCFTLQSCWGHFLYRKGQNKDNLDVLAKDHILNIKVLYRIAYIALCIKDSRQGRGLLVKLRKIVDIDKDYIQFGCAEWFWKVHPNSFALQVEPYRYCYKDSVRLSYSEALHVQKIKKEFFLRLETITGKLQ